MTKTLETEKSSQLRETQLSSPGGPVVMNHVWKRYTSHRCWFDTVKRWSGVSETRRDSTLTSKWW